MSRRELLQEGEGEAPNRATPEQCLALFTPAERKVIMKVGFVWIHRD